MTEQGAHKHVLDRELRKAELKEIIDEMYPILVDIVDESSWVLREAFTRYDGNRENLAIPLLCHSQFEMLDAMSELCKEAIYLPAYLQLRSIQESHYYSRFLDKSGDLFQRRAIAYVYEYHRQYMVLGRRLESIKGEDSDWIEKHLEELAEKGFKETIDEHKRAKKENGNRSCQWYSLFNGPANFTDLTKEVLAHIPEGADGSAEANSIMYGMYSQGMHANDHYMRISSNNDGTAEIKSFRTFNKINDFVVCYGLAARMTLFSVSILLQRNCTNSFKRGVDLWINNFQPRLQKLERFTPEEEVNE